MAMHAAAAAREFQVSAHVAERLASGLSGPDSSLAEYCSKKMCPLLGAIIDELFASRPDNPSVFLALWLLERSGAARALMGELFGGEAPPPKTGGKRASGQQPSSEPKQQRPSSARAALAARDDNVVEAQSVIEPLLPSEPSSGHRRAPRKSIMKPTTASSSSEEGRRPSCSKVGKKGCLKSTVEETPAGCAVPTTPAAKAGSAVATTLAVDAFRVAEASANAEAPAAAAPDEGKRAKIEEPAKRCVSIWASHDLASPSEKFGGKGEDKENEEDDDNDDGDEDDDDDDEEGAKKEEAVFTSLRGSSKVKEGGGDGGPPKRLDRKFSIAASSTRIEMPPMEEAIKLLRKVAAFSGYRDEDLRQIAGIAGCNRYFPEENIVCFGNPSSAVHIVVSGCGKVSVPRAVGEVKCGDVFGDESLRFAGATCPSQVEAHGGPITTMSIPAAMLSALKIRKQNILEKSKNEKRAGQMTVVDVKHDKQSLISEDSGRPIVQDYVQSLADRDLIMAAVKNNKVLSEVMQLDDAQNSLVCDSVHLIKVPKGETLMNKGDPGRALYIVQDGLLSVSVNGDEDENEEGHFKVRVGDAFGELALLYDTPRSATITALRDCILWVLMRADFKEVTRTNYSSRIASYVELLKKIPCLQDRVSGEDYEVVAGVLEEMAMVEGEEMCIQGEDAGVLFIIYEGCCEAQSESDDDIAKRVLGCGDWIGERQLTESIAAEATVTVASETAIALVLDMSSLNMVTKANKAFKHWNSDMELRTKAGMADTFVTKRLSRAMCRKSLAKIQSQEERPQEPNYNPQSLERLHVLGEGSFGSVLLMKDPVSGTEYAVKALVKEQLLRDKQTKTVSSERAIMSILQSDFIVRLFKTFQDQNNIYFVLDPALGGELFDVFMDTDIFGSLPHARFYLACVTLGLQHMHLNRVIYRDLKLENCILDLRGYVKLADFGISKIVLGKTYSVVGTADYFAPETLRQSGHNRAVDWWAAGVLLFVMFAGQSPFDAPEVTQIYKNIMKGFSKVKFPPNFTSDVVEVVKSLCRKKPEDRITMQKGGVDNLMSLPFFIGLDWNALSLRTLEPPFVPAPPDSDKMKTRTLQRDFEIDEDTVEWDGTPPCEE